MKDRIPLVADILMGAAYADSHFHGEEKNAVRRLLRQVLGGAALPMDLEFRIDEFDAAAFDLGETAAAFASEPLETRRRLLELVSAVHAADQEYDLSEDDYVHRLAAALGVGEAHYRDLAVTVIEEIDLAPLK
ncbi:MAG TPA: TerB family tellurite resistance protein [Polyangia bacterium]|nr:TerB family tellurite resistance protein [Polyangia bacterium]